MATKLEQLRQQYRLTHQKTLRATEDANYHYYLGDFATYSANVERAKNEEIDAAAALFRAEEEARNNDERSLLKTALLNLAHASRYEEKSIYLREIHSILVRNVGEGTTFPIEAVAQLLTEW